MGKGENKEGRKGGDKERRRRISYYCYYITFGDKHQSCMYKLAKPFLPGVGGETVISAIPLALVVNSLMSSCLAFFLLARIGEAVVMQRGGGGEQGVCSSEIGVEGGDTGVDAGDTGVEGSVFSGDARLSSSSSSLT